MPTKMKDVEYTGTGNSPLRQAAIDSILNGDIVIDVGCRMGGWIRPRYDQGWSGKELYTVGIDPIWHNISDLFSLYVNYAIGPEDRDDMVYHIVANEPGCNSLLPPSEELLATQLVGGQLRSAGPAEKVQQRRLDTVLKEAGFTPGESTVHYLKTDCQGADFSAVQSMGEFLKDTRYVEMEIGLDPENPFYVGAERAEDVIAGMESLGFKLIEFVNFPVSPLPEGELFFKRNS